VVTSSLVNILPCYAWNQYHYTGGINSILFAPRPGSAHNYKRWLDLDSRGGIICEGWKKDQEKKGEKKGMQEKKIKAREGD